MKKYSIKCSLLGLCLIFIICSCEKNYNVGVSSVSIEPTDETISLTLAGYAAPYMGRFSLTWHDMGLFHQVCDITTLNNKIYYIDPEKKLMVMDKFNYESAKVIDKNIRIEYLAGMMGRLYGVTPSGEILVANPESDKMEWNKITQIEEITAITAYNNKLLITTKKGELLSGTVENNKFEWTKAGQAQNIIDMACDENRLYAISSEKLLLQKELKDVSREWLRIGYNNKDTYTIDIRKIIHSDGKIYALASDNHVYMSRHNTEGKMTANAAAISYGKETAVIVGVDACGFDYSFTNKIKEEIYRKRGIPAEAILINASHSHFVPVTQSWITWEEPNQCPDTLYLYNVVYKGIIQAIEEALDNRVPSLLSFGKGTTEIGRNRSLAGDLALYDNSLDVIKISPVNTNEEYALFMTGCHPVITEPDVGNYKISPNFPGYARELIEKTSITKSIFLQGCAGDINPKETFKRSGEELAKNTTDVLNSPMSVLKGSISYALDTLNIPVTTWTKDSVLSFKEDAKKNPEDGLARRDVRWANIMLNHFKNNLSDVMPVYVQTINIGNWKLIGLSREVTTEFGIRIKELYPEKNVSVIAYTNDVSSYLSSDPHILNQDYEGYGSFFWYGQPSQFPLKTLDSVVYSIKEKNR